MQKFSTDQRDLNCPKLSYFIAYNLRKNEITEFRLGWQVPKWKISTICIKIKNQSS